MVSGWLIFDWKLRGGDKSDNEKISKICIVWWFLMITAEKFKIRKIDFLLTEKPQYEFHTKHTELVWNLKRIFSVYRWLHVTLGEFGVLNPRIINFSTLLRIHVLRHAYSSQKKSNKVKSAIKLSRKKVPSQGKSASRFELKILIKTNCSIWKVVGVDEM